MKKLLLSLLALLCCAYIYAQDLPKLTPLSPNAASIVKYGEIPVGHFTGVPNIGIPIYTISSGDLTLPLSLSYHAGGNRVESIASWVGLGWSLGSIPSISRSVRGIPDENGGYFSKYSGKTVKELWELPSGNNILNAYRTHLFEGVADSEPDIFNYNILGESGKFFYNQESETFITYPKSNTKIIREGTAFKLIDKKGVEYLFNINETTNSFGATVSTPVTLTWYASKIESANKKDSIRLTYQHENQSIKTRSVTLKHQYIGGQSHVNGLSYQDNNNSILTTHATTAKVLDSIIFSNGYVKLNRSSLEREDLRGSYNLNNISVYTDQNQLISKHEFTFRYKGGSTSGACYNVDSYSRKWMFLDKVVQVSADSSGKLTHQFNYDESGSFPCRWSAAQDYWGYYNGHDSNKSLTPSFFIPNTTIQIVGANREVNSITSKFGVLKKIIYPTGGYTEFDFENNMAFEEGLLSQYTTDDEVLSGDEFIDFDETLPDSNTFEKEFTINNPSDPVLNNDNPNGGSQVTFTLQFPGCDISQGANNCARFTIKNISTSIIYDIHLNGTSYYLPNGTYKLKVEFNQEQSSNQPQGPDYQDFIFIAKWNIILPGQTENKNVGGLRIKEIRSYTNTSSLPLTKKYKYTTGYNSTISSGGIFGSPNFSHTDVIQYDYHGVSPINPSAHYLAKTLYLRIRSISNMQQVTHSGSFVGYENVIEETENIDKTGYTEYKFSHSRDSYNSFDMHYTTNFTISGININNESDGEGFPYAPAENMELYRGKLLMISSYKKSGTSFKLVHEKSLGYSDNAFTLNNLYPKYSLGIKWGNSVLSNEVLGFTNGFIYNRAQNMTRYSVLSSWNNLKTETEILYDINGQNPITTTTNHFYDNASHLLKTRTETTDSQGKLLISKVKYPQDILNPSPSITNLIGQNRLGEVIESMSYKDLNSNSTADSNELLTAQKNKFKTWFANIVFPEFIQSSKGSNPLEDRIVFHSYYDNGNVKEVYKKDGTHIVYIWGYNETQLIAKIENFTTSGLVNIQSLVDAAVLASNNDVNSNKENELRTALAAIRNHSSLSNSQISTFTYDPLIGVTSVTDPRGRTVYYLYDAFNRLQYVKDHDGNILSKNEYNYKN